MPTLIAGVVAVILLYSLLQMFRAANPVVLARAVKIGGGVGGHRVAVFTGTSRELGAAVALGLVAAAWAASAAASPSALSARGYWSGLPSARLAFPISPGCSEA